MRANNGGFGEICQSLPQLFTSKLVRPVNLRVRNEKFARLAALRIPNPFESAEGLAVRTENYAAAARIGD